MGEFCQFCATIWNTSCLFALFILMKPAMQTDKAWVWNPTYAWSTESILRIVILFHPSLSHTAVVKIRCWKNIYIAISFMAWNAAPKMGLPVALLGWKGSYFPGDNIGLNLSLNFCGLPWGNNSTDSLLLWENNDFPKLFLVCPDGGIWKNHLAPLHPWKSQVGSKLGWNCMSIVLQRKRTDFPS